MKIIQSFFLGSLCLITASLAYSVPTSSDYKTIEENIVFSSTDEKMLPPPIKLIMGHKDGLKTRDFYLPEDSPYSEMKTLTRQHITGDGRIGGYFVDELISKDGQYVIILGGQVYEEIKDGKKIYSKHGTWMDDLGHMGTWVDDVQAQHPSDALAACGGK